jgi:chromatin remodeling complex protein RSC6
MNHDHGGRATSSFSDLALTTNASNMSSFDEEGLTKEEIEDMIKPQSRLPAIWDHYNKQLDQIDELEKRLDEQANRSRRRLACMLDQTATHRRSHLRLFVTHKYDSELSKYTLVVEGKLLVGLKDHASAAIVEQEGAHAIVKATEPAPSPLAAAAAARAEADAVASTSKSDRNQYRSVGEKEEDPVEPVIFTHFFDKVVIRFQTIYQPIENPNTPSLTPKKGRSAKRKSDKIEVIPTIHPKHLKSSETTKIVWTKNQTPDAHAFMVAYTNKESQIPPPPDMKFHSVVANITMHTTRAEPCYKPNAELADKFFPKHRNDDARQQRSTTSVHKRKKTESDEAQESSSVIALENEIHVPSLLNMDEIIMALFQYIYDKKLQDPTDKSLVVCDKVLSGLFEGDSFNFSQLESLLLSKELITEVTADEDPINLTYILTESTASLQVPLGTSDPAAATAKEETTDGSVQTPQPLSFDMDVSVPALFHYRTRELMRRIKRREFEYTSSRTKARYLLVASRGNEDIVKNKIEQVVSGRGYSAENIPIYLALAKAAPANSEARASAQTDAKICSLLERLEEFSRGAETAWDLVDACRGMSQGD